jgi:hypothetical protein
MKRVLALLFALAMAVPAAAARLPKPISPIDRMPKDVELSPSVGQTKAEKTRKGRPVNPLALPVTPPQLQPSVKGK